MPHYGALGAICPETQFRLSHQSATGQEKLALAMKLHRQLGISYNAAWRMRHKLMQVMMERDRAHPLGGFIQLDDAYLGGERSGASAGAARRARPLSSPRSRPTPRATRCA